MVWCGRSLCNGDWNDTESGRMILCCGDALIDMLPMSTRDGHAGFRPCSGGSVFNTACALGRLDVPVGIMVGLSTDMFGQKLRDDLEQSCVDLSYVHFSDRPTTLAFVQVNDGDAHYMFYDEHSAGRMFSDRDAKFVGDDIDALFFGGISLVAEPVAETYTSIVENEGGSRLVVLDPNIRPSFIRDVDRYRERLARILNKTDVCKVSDEDMHWMFPSSDSVREKIDHLFDLGPSLVIRTSGAAGATAYLKDVGDVHHPATVVRVVDTVGAGDAFDAGFLASLYFAKHLDKTQIPNLSLNALQVALAFGATVASITVSRRGSNPPWRNELSKSFPKSIAD